MRDHLSRFAGRLTYANVASTLALFLVLTGGAAYAVNTVRSEDIVDGQVKTVDIGTNAVKSTKIADLQVTTDDLANHSVDQDKLGFGAVPDRADMLQSASAMDTTTTKEVTVNCRFAEDAVTGGGFVVAGPGGANVPTVSVQRSYAVNKNTWLVRAVAASGTPTWQLVVIANCML